MTMANGGTGAYVPLIRLAVTHRFFDDGVCRHLRFTPDSATARLIGNRGLLTRQHAAGLDIYCEDGKQADLTQRSTDPMQRPCLFFMAHSTDPYFEQYTEGVPSRTERKIQLFDSRNAVAEAAGGKRLHTAECAGEADAQAIDALAPQRLDENDVLRLSPLFAIRLWIDDTEACPHFCIRFAARASYWKYYIDDALSGRELTIVDLDGQENFAHVGSEALGKRQSRIFLSHAAIPMRERHTQRFQLRERGAMGEKVVVKRLPNASVNRIGMEKIDGKAALVSEMYIG